MKPRAWLWFLLALAWALPAQAEPPELNAAGYASFALIVGVNRSVDRDAPLLRYADDDAARYLDLFRTLGARSYVLTRPDDNTRRLHPQVAAEAQPPRLREYRRVIAALAADVAQARARGIKTVLYFVYAGHGNAQQGSGYITLEDARLHASDLEQELLERIKPDQEHLIVDACYSYLLAVGRGPGGKRREARGFSQLGGLSARPTTGLLFSTSSAKESHEWAGFQAGVFSHEVRSGLYGAADADGDGRVSYREIGAFIQQANASVANERFRPDVYVKAPAGSDVLVDLDAQRGARLDFRGAPSEHQLLEDERGVRLADIHNGSGAAYLLRPRSGGKLYLRRLRDGREVLLPLVPTVVAVAELAPEEGRIAQRGAANDAFESLFALPFDRSVVQRFRFKQPEAMTDDGATAARPQTRRYVGLGMLGLSALGAGVGTWGLLHANSHQDRITATSSQADAARENEQIKLGNWSAGVGYGVAGGALTAGLMLLLWPDHGAELRIDPEQGQALAGFHGRF